MKNSEDRMDTANFLFDTGEDKFSMYPSAIKFQINSILLEENKTRCGRRAQANIRHGFHFEAYEFEKMNNPFHPEGIIASSIKLGELTRFS